ncbi:3-dehydroquinate synthase [Terrisporobacter sp.]|uniref:3-dehydroquinate synthase n=1 Tax=Terrisporobacter sp. TaxID=1965305 RepID=UPI002628EE5E|nr:3-dehydroquinate synthase [Terrisporobacter sp.]
MERIINNTCKIYIDEGYRSFQKCLYEVCNLNSIEELNKKYDAYFVICDYNTYNYQLYNMMTHLHGSYIYEYIINPGEDSKSLEDYERIITYCKKVNLSRKSLIIALGGGVVGDLAGFVAATYMRGIDYVQIPTSLLAQVDSSIGGKTGINLGNSKNIIGAFHQPKMTFINVESLKTLPEKEYLSGMGEVIKYALIKDYDLLNYLIDNYEDILDIKTSTMINMVRRCAQIKADIVNEDEKEGGLRRILNLGHTFAHGIEKLCNISHGEAVTIGINMAFKLSLRKNLIEPEYYNKFLELCEKFQLPLNFNYEDEKEIFNIMKNDKKNSFNKINLVLPVGKGNVEVVDNIEEDLIIDVIKECKNA